MVYQLEIHKEYIDKKIIFLDGDQYYPSIMILQHHELRDKPFGVILRKERSPVAAASYPAREYGITAGMSRKEAYQLYPGLPLILGSRKEFRKVSDWCFEITRECIGTEKIQRYSIDEMFVDVTDVVVSFDEANELARKVRRKIKNDIGITFSAGIANAKYPAKMLGEHEKPDGQTTAISEEEWKEIMWGKPARKLIGVGPSNEIKLKKNGINTIEEVANKPKDYITSILGKTGETVWEFAWGRDDSEVKPYYMPWDQDSVNSTFTLYYDTRYPITLEWWLHKHSSVVAKELQDHDRYCRTVVLWSGFRSEPKPRSRMLTMKRYVNEEEDVYQPARVLLEKRLKENPKELWMLGVGVRNLIKGEDLRERQLELDLGKLYV